MLDQGMGRRAWRNRYPADKWATYQRKQLENGDRLVMLQEKAGMRSAVLTFYHKDNDLHWVIHCDGHITTAKDMFVLLETEAARHPIRADYSALPNFARF